MTRLLRLALALLALAAGPAAHAQAGPDALRRAIDAALDHPRFADAHWGVHVVDLSTGETLYDRNAARNFVPASNQKLVTTAAALALLGPDFRYRTGLYWAGTVADSTLTGHLLVRGGGDPTFGGRPGADADPTAVFRAWADSLRARGIARVTGHVIGLDDVFDDAPLGEGWSWDDEPFYYAAQISGLAFRENVVDLTVRPGARVGARARLEWDPATDYVYFINESTTRGSRTQIREGYERLPGSNTFRVTTAVPLGKVERERLAVFNPTKYFAHVLRDVLRQRGVAVEGEAVDGDDWPEALEIVESRRVAEHVSPPLAEIAPLVNKESVNLYAEHLLRSVGAYTPRPGEQTPGSAAAGARSIALWLQTMGVDADGMRIADGSGLSGKNRVAPEDLTALLRAMWTHPDPAVREAFVASLAVGGQDGTLRGRFRSGRGRGNVRAKTGFIASVRTLSGYVTTAAGTPLAFSILTNGYSTSRSAVSNAQDDVVQALAGYRR